MMSQKGLQIVEDKITTKNICPPKDKENNQFRTQLLNRCKRLCDNSNISMITLESLKQSKEKK